MFIDDFAARRYLDAIFPSVHDRIDHSYLLILLSFPIAVIRQVPASAPSKSAALAIGYLSGVWTADIGNKKYRISPP